MAGIDPAMVTVMRRVDAADRELAALPDSEALRDAGNALLARRHPARFALPRRAATRPRPGIDDDLVRLVGRAPCAGRNAA